MPFSRSELDALLGLAERGHGRDLRAAGRVRRRRRRARRPSAGADRGRLRWSAPRPTRTRSPRSRPSSATTSSCCPGPPEVPDVVEDAPTLEGNARLKAVALADGHRAARGGRRHRSRGRRRSAARPGCSRPATPASDATYDENVAKLLRELDGVAPARPARPLPHGGAWWRWPDGREVVAEGVCAGLDRGRAAGRARVRLRPGLRPRPTATAARSPR